jgi:hypothetical protein
MKAVRRPIIGGRHDHGQARTTMLPGSQDIRANTTVTGDPDT